MATARRRPPPRKPSKAGIKAAADRAEKRTKGEDVDEPKAPITPPIVPAAKIKAEKKAKKRSRGRRTKYNPALGRAICKMLSEGLSVRAVARRPGMPSAARIVTWGNDPAHPFSKQYARAREASFLLMSEDIVEISDDGSNDWMKRYDKEGDFIGWRENGEAMARSRLRVDSRKWLLSKMLPKVYGEKASLEHSGPGGGPIEVADISKLDLARWIAQQFAAATAPTALVSE